MVEMVVEPWGHKNCKPIPDGEVVFLQYQMQKIASEVAAIRGRNHSQALVCRPSAISCIFALSEMAVCSSGASSCGGSLFALGTSLME